MGKGGSRGLKTALVLIAVLALAIFFSRTLYFYRLPEVSAVQPFRGFLNKLEISWGLASWAERETIYARRSGLVGEVWVREGQEVEAGQILLSMDFDVEEAERKLREIRNNLEKLQNSIDFTEARLGALNRALDGSPEGEGRGPAALELERAERERQVAELFYSLGERSRHEAEAAGARLEALRLGYEGERESLRFDLAAKRLDLLNLGIQEEAQAAILRDYRNHAVLRSPVRGTVVSLNAARGGYVLENSPLIVLGAGNEFVVECTVSAENNFILPGDLCELSNAAHTLKGTVLTVKPGEGGKIVAVGVVSDELRAGESFEVYFEKTGSAPLTLVPNAALNQDGQGYFLNRIKRRRGIMGEEYYVDRLDVYIGDSDLNNTAIIRGLSFFEPVVLRGDKPVAPGDLVSLLNPEDFFEN